MWECSLCGKKTHSVYEINCLFEHNGEKRNICNNCYQLVDKYKKNPHSLEIKEKINTYYEICDPNVKIYIEEILIRKAISNKKIMNIIKS